MEDVEHHQVGGVVEQRRTGPDADDEAGELPHVPRPRLFHLLRIDVVGGDGGLADVVKQVIGKDLDWHHRQVWHEDARPQDAEHVPEVAAGAHSHVFEDVGKHLPALDDARLQDEKRFFQEDHVGRRLCDIDGRVDTDADVGGPQRRRIVDAVAHEPHGVIACLQGPDNPLLVRRRHAGEERGLRHGVGELSVGHGIEVGAKKHMLRRQADFLADFAGHEIVVAREHLHLHAAALQ